MRQISHDPFGRFSVYSDRVYTASECAWCGQHKQTPTGRPYLIRYSSESDSIGSRRESNPRLFCSISCLRCFAH